MVNNYQQPYTGSWTFSYPAYDVYVTWRVGGMGVSGDV